MKRKQYILFDLDGTVTEPFEGITNCVAYALKHFGIEAEDKSTLRPFIGPPLIESFQEFYGFSKEQAEEATKKYRELYNVEGIFQNELYKGMEELLAFLKEQGKTVVLATSKPDVFANRILSYFKIDQYFDFVAGSEINGGRNTKIAVIQYALDQTGITDVSQAVMVGDRKFDILGAQHFGMDSVGVLYGHGSREELEQAGATKIVETVSELKNLL